MKLITLFIIILISIVLILLPSWAAKSDQIFYADLHNENINPMRSPYSEPSIMILFGISLISLARLSRKKLKK
jgi:hypothetical protein